MSHYIQDNQTIIRTADSRILLFIKGGDNNCYSYDNKRVTSWHLQNTFSNEDEYNDYITELLMSDISGCSWQFASLKNKSFIGYTEYENIIYNRFDKALKNALFTTWRLSDLTVDNIYEFENNLMNIFRGKNISLKDESGCENGLGFIWSYTDDVTKEEAAINRLNKSNIYKQRGGNEKYKTFCQKYSDRNIAELINDVRFCSDIVKFNKTWNKSISVLEKLKGVIATNEVNFASFNLLTNSNEKTVKDLLHTYYMESLLRDYPMQFETLNCLNVFHTRAKSILAKELQKDDDYLYKKYKKNYDFIVNANYAELKNEKKSIIKDIKSGAKDRFIEIWNGLIDDCWYKTTNERLPRKVKELKIELDIKTFTLDEVKEDCKEDFRKIVTHHKHQQKKNQSVIKKVFKDLINEYYLLFDENSIDEICTYFGFEKPLQEEQIKIKEVVEIKEQDKVINLTQLSLFDFAA